MQASHCHHLQGPAVALVFLLPLLMQPQGQVWPGMCLQQLFRQQLGPLELLPVELPRSEQLLERGSPLCLQEEEYCFLRLCYPCWHPGHLLGSPQIQLLLTAALQALVPPARLLCLTVLLSLPQPQAAARQCVNASQQHHRLQLIRGHSARISASSKHKTLKVRWDLATPALRAFPRCGGREAPASRSRPLHSRSAAASFEGIT